MPLESEDQQELSEIEAALGSLVPTRSRVDRDRVMYQAGRASVQPASSGRRAWIGVAASLGLVALGEATLLARRPSERVVDRVIVVREPSAAPTLGVAEVLAPSAPARPSLGLGPADHDRMAWQVLRYGLDGLPAPRPSAGDDRAVSRQILSEELGKVLELGDPS